MKVSSFLFIIISLLLIFLLSGCSKENPEIKEFDNFEVKEKMKLTSPAFENNQTIPARYTCQGKNINPPLSISGIPAKAKSLALIMDDPDAVNVAGKVWDHWVVFNIPVSEVDIPEGKEPSGVHGKGTAQNLNYAGPCPPDREHRYYFKVFALDTVLNLPTGSMRKEVEAAMKGHVLASGELMGRYKKK